MANWKICTSTLLVVAVRRRESRLGYEFRIVVLSMRANRVVHVIKNLWQIMLLTC